MTRNHHTHLETALNIVGLIASLLIIFAIAWIAAGVFPLELEF